MDAMSMIGRCEIRMSATYPIRVWKFSDAPKKFQRLSTNGGDEDWLAELPLWAVSCNPPWLAGGTPFGWCCVEWYKHPSVPGWCIAIGSHS